MTATDRLETARDSYRAYETGDRSLIERSITDDFTFFSGPDPGIDRATYFERCWPNHERTRSFAFTRLAEMDDDEVLVTYEAQRVDGTRFCNTEVLRFRGDAICRAEVYFGWEL